MDSTKLLNKKIVQKVRRDNCFDFLRYLFAFSLIIAHFCTLTNNDQFWFITGSMRVKAFFVITGFLVTYSFLRRDCDIRSYAIKRFVRIVPAYIVCILLCFLLGMLVSSINIHEFLISTQTWKYLIVNILMLNWLEPELPFTFQNNFMPQMNGSLWSMKQEIIFYILVPFIMYSMTKIGKRKIVLPIILFIVFIYNNLNVQTQYFTYFISGMSILLFFDLFCHYQRFFLLFCIISECLLYTIDIPYITSMLHSIEPVTFAGLIIGFAYNVAPLNFFRKFDNITYGLYLYHFPVIQTLILFGFMEYGFTECLVVTFIISAILASISWYVIEKPLMNKYK